LFSILSHISHLKAIFNLECVRDYKNDESLILKINTRDYMIQIPQEDTILSSPNLEHQGWLVIVGQFGLLPLVEAFP